MRVIGSVVLIMLGAAVHASARPPVAGGACAVLTRSDVAAVQGEAYTSAKASAHGEISQCFYQLPTFVNSISLDLIQRDGREFWEEHFERSEENDEPEETTRPPRRVEGIGDEAFWVASRVAGSLYVRKGDKVLRVSVGGAASEAAKIERSKKLAAKALRREGASATSAGRPRPARLSEAATQP